MSTAPHTTNTDTTETAITMALSTPEVVSVVTLSTPGWFLLSFLKSYYILLPMRYFVFVNE